MNVQDEKEREITKYELRITQPPQLVSALDKKSQLMKIAVIQPPIAGDPQTKKVIEFKHNMSQFNIVDKVDFFK